MEKRCQQETCSSSDFAFEENGARLDLHVRNQEGVVSPMLVIAPQSESPGTIRSVSSEKYSPCRGGPDVWELASPSLDPTTLKLADSEATLPLGRCLLFHLYSSTFSYKSHVPLWPMG